MPRVSSDAASPLDGGATSLLDGGATSPLDGDAASPLDGARPLPPNPSGSGSYLLDEDAWEWVLQPTE